MFIHKYEDIISIENLLVAWKEFRNGKRSKEDVQIFERNLMENIILLHKDLVKRSYKHSNYTVFNISDPKPRTIHKASVRDRLLHHAIHRILYPYFDKKFIFDSYSCRVGKGTHAALNRFRDFGYKGSYNNTKTLWILKCDIKKFFASIDQAILSQLLKKYIPDVDIIWLLSEVIYSFSLSLGKGIPLGNLTSQLFANIYLNELDKFVKHNLKIKFYIRYADDFVLLSVSKQTLKEYIPKMRDFLRSNLSLDLHEFRISLKTLTSGADYLGWVHFFDHRVLRTVTKHRMFRNIIISKGKIEVIQSYFGLISHGNTHKIYEQINSLLGLPRRQRLFSSVSESKELGKQLNK